MVLCVLATRDDDEDRRFFSMRAGIQFKTLQLFLREFPMRLTQDRKPRLCGFLIPNSEERSVLEFNCARVA